MREFILIAISTDRDGDIDREGAIFEFFNDIKDVIKSCKKLEVDFDELFVIDKQNDTVINKLVIEYLISDDFEELFTVKGK